MSKKEDLIKILNNKHNFSISDAKEICSAVEDYENEIRNSGAKEALANDPLKAIDRQIKMLRNRKNQLRERLINLSSKKTEIIKNSKKTGDVARRERVRNKSRAEARTSTQSTLRRRAKVV